MSRPAETRRGQPRRARRHDPHRRERIADAAEAVIAELGIEALTHRAVAQRADVPLGSTTYHFASRDDLIQVALERATDRFLAHEAGWLPSGKQEADLEGMLADRVLDYCFGDWRTRSIVCYELYLAALRRPALRATANRYNDAVAATLAGLVGPVRASALTALLDGLSLRCLLADRAPDRRELRDLIACVLPG
ncbi:TetR/AcrR family transcriptional regulator [Amycolatopsis palatopharyngis]|uniref:TetR/AcrR family transcriptional regulator n=1 Tax=Amycolatopsis palatopharyngis TaxID=187982 RepID=UPI000E2490AA|nr:TetR family transcriptional regulator [Amycolatopsis palatopharyngis]